MLKKMLDYFYVLNNEIVNNIREISVKQSVIAISFEDGGALFMSDLTKIDNFCEVLSVTNITAFQDMIHVHFDGLREDLAEGNDKCPLIFFYQIILILRDILCTCPALEYVISNDYVKVYIDLPNIHVKDLNGLEELFKSEGILEINNQRPYVLYVRDWDW